MYKEDKNPFHGMITFTRLSATGNIWLVEEITISYSYSLAYHVPMNHNIFTILAFPKACHTIITINGVES